MAYYFAFPVIDIPLLPNTAHFDDANAIIVTGFDVSLPSKGFL